MRSKVIKLMQEQGWTARALSRAAGLNDTAIRDLLTRHRSVRMASLEAIASALRVDVTYLLSDEATLSADEVEFAKALRRVSPAQRALLRAMAEQFAASAPPPAKDDDQPD
jgi:transcriptional regulator with XRE-family HTH domain